MAKRVKQRDGGRCVFTGSFLSQGDQHNCHILAAAPSQRLLHRVWWLSYRPLLAASRYGHLQDYVMSLDEYEKKKAPLGFRWPADVSRSSYIIAVPCIGREYGEAWFSTKLGLCAHSQYSDALGAGEVQLELYDRQPDSNNALDFGVNWSLADQHHHAHFNDKRLPTQDKDGNRTFEDWPKHGPVFVPVSLEGQMQWPERLVFELYSQVWYPYCRWKEQQDEEQRR